MQKSSIQLLLNVEYVVRPNSVTKIYSKTSQTSSANYFREIVLYKATQNNNPFGEKFSIATISSLVITQKGESKNGCFKKTKHTKFSEKLIPPDTQTYVCVSGSKKCSFWGNSACFVFLKQPFLHLPFCLITDESCSVFLLYNIMNIYSCLPIFPAKPHYLCQNLRSLRHSLKIIWFNILRRQKIEWFFKSLWQNFENQIEARS